MDFERHSASHFGVIPYESLNQLHIHVVFSPVITQEAMNNCYETALSRFLRPVQQIGELVTFYDLLDLRSDEDTSLDLCLHSQLPVTHRHDTPTKYPCCVGSASE